VLLARMNAQPHAYLYITATFTLPPSASKPNQASAALLRIQLLPDPQNRTQVETLTSAFSMSAATTAPTPAVATPMAPPPSYPASSTISASVAASVEEEDDLYGRLKSLQRHMEFVEIQEEYVKDEQKNLKRELLRAQEEVKRIQSVPLVIGQFMEMVDGNNGIVGSTTGSNYYVRILSTINRELLKPSASVALHRHSNALVDVLPPEADSSISLLGSSEKPNVTYNVSLSLNLPDPHEVIG
jgi:26S proteasome regulatory subunit T3